MSKKVLIAGIGGGKNKETGTYRVANYKIENKVYEQRSFITSALEEHYGIDKIIFIGTMGSMNFILKNIKKTMMKIIILI